jgi:hypothetical protein
MRKLKLESLQVQSFATTTSAPASRGTVQAHAGSDWPTCACLLSDGGDGQSCDPGGCQHTGDPNCNLVFTDFSTCVDWC